MARRRFEVMRLALFATLVATTGHAAAARAHESGEAPNASDADATSGGGEPLFLWRRGDASVALRGLLQADTVFVHQAAVDELDPSTGEPLNEVRFLIRRARLGADAAYDVRFLVVGAILQFDGNTVRGPAVQLQRAEVTAALPGARPLLSAGVGLMKIPFGAEVPQEMGERAFLEQTHLSRALFPGDLDLGLRVRGEWRFLRVVLAAMNGQPLGDAAFPLRDPNQQKDVVGRAGIDTELFPGVTLRAGASGVAGVGFHAGAGATKDSLVWRDQNEDGIAQAAELVVIKGRAAEESQTFRRYAIGGDARMIVDVPWLGDLTVGLDGAVAQNLDRGFFPADPVAVGHDVRELGWSAFATQQISPHVFLGIRYDEYNPDLDSLEGRGGRVVPSDATISTWAFAVALALPPFARLLVEYDHEDNALGRNAHGARTTLASDALTARAQVTF